jgi:hypothetical protein
MTDRNALFRHYRGPARHPYHLRSKEVFQQKEKAGPPEEAGRLDYLHLWFGATERRVDSKDFADSSRLARTEASRSTFAGLVRTSQVIVQRTALSGSGYPPSRY